MTYYALAPLVLVKDAEGAFRYRYQGAEISDDTPGEEIDRLVADGLIGELDEEPTFPIGDPEESWTVPQLKAYAEAKGVDLDGAKTKADILSKF